MNILKYKNKISSLLRACAAISVGIVMLFPLDAPESLAKVIGYLLFGTGLFTLIMDIYVNIRQTKQREIFNIITSFRSVVDIILGALLLMYPAQLGDFVVSVVGILLLIISIVNFMIIGRFGCFPTVLLVMAGLFLLFNPFSMGVMKIIAGALLLAYGLNEILTIIDEIRNKRQMPGSGGFGFGRDGGWSRGPGRAGGWGRGSGRDGGWSRGSAQKNSSERNGQGVNSVEFVDDNSEFNVNTTDLDDVKSVEYEKED